MGYWGDRRYVGGVTTTGSGRFTVGAGVPLEPPRNEGQLREALTWLLL